MTRRIFAAATALLFAEVANAAPSCTPMEMREGRPFVTIALAGAPVRALLDSGAEATVVDAAYAAKAGFARGAAATARGSGGTTEAEALSAVAVSVAGRTLPDVHPYAIDLSEVSARLLKEKVDVVLGREIFDRERVLLDYAGKRLCLVGRETEPAGVRLALETARGLESIPIEVEGRAVRADVDTGNSGALMLGAGFVAEGGFLTDGRKVGENRGGGLGGPIVRKRFIARRVTVAGETFSGVPAVVDPLENANPANIGSGLLRRFRVTLDFGEGAAWLERN